MHQIKTMFTWKSDSAMREYQPRSRWSESGRDTTEIRPKRFFHIPYPMNVPISRCREPSAFVKKANTGVVGSSDPVIDDHVTVVSCQGQTSVSLHVSSLGSLRAHTGCSATRASRGWTLSTASVKVVSPLTSRHCRTRRADRATRLLTCSCCLRQAALGSSASTHRCSTCQKKKHSTGLVV